MPTPNETTPGRVTRIDGQGNLPMLEIATRWSTAELYLHGAHVTGFRKRDEPPLLFMSQNSRFIEGQPIRGGIPLIFPWFGPREGKALHGFARIKTWELKEATPAPDGSVRVRLELPDCPERKEYPPFTLEYTITVADRLTLELVTTNKSDTAALEFENCLHTYFAVDDIAAVSIAGLKGLTYIDKLDNLALKTEFAETIQVTSEVDRVYLDATSAAEIHDARFGRVIGVEKEGSASTVVWNPWIAKAQQMPDFGDEEYRSMVCVESANAAANKIRLAPGQTARLKVTLTSRRLG